MGTSNLNKDKIYNMYEGVLYEKLKAPTLVSLYEFEYSLRMLQTTEYKRFRDIFATLSNGATSKNKEFYIFNKETMRVILNKLDKVYIFTNCLSMGCHWSTVEEVSDECIKLNTTAEYKFTIKSLLKLAERFARICTIDNDYFERQEIFKGK